MIENKSPKQNLDAIGVLIEDTDPKSLYFNMTVPDIIPGGKTAISIDPPPQLLKLSSNVKVEVLDANGNPVYVEFPNDPFVGAYEHGYSEEGSTARLLSITVYSSTPYGYGEIIVVGEALKVMPNGLPIPAQWRGVYNVRWRKKILLDRNKKNDSKVIFYKTPEVSVAEIQKAYLDQSYLTSRVVTQSGTITYYRGYDFTMITAVDFDFTQDMVGGLLTVPSPQVGTYYTDQRLATAGPYITYIDSLINKRQAYVRDSYSLTRNANTPYLSTRDAQNYLGVKSFLDSSCTLQYNASPTYVSSPNLKSFAKFDITNLDTFSGDVYRLKVFQNSAGTMGGYNFAAEKNLEDTEILFNHDSIDPTYQYMGVFVGSKIFNSYWATSSTNFSAGNYGAETNTFIPTVTFDSNTLMNGMVISSSVAWDTTNGQVVQFFFPTTQSFFNKGDQLELSFKLANLSGDGRFEVYASGSAFYQNYRRLEKDWDSGRGGTPLLYDVVNDTPTNPTPAVDRFGKLITSFGPEGVGQYKTEKKLYGTITAPIQTDWSGSGSINIAVHGGQWAISDISLVYKRETNFSPSAFSFSIPLEPEQEGDAVSFGIKYYNSLGQEVLIPKTPSPTAAPNMTFGMWKNNQNLNETEYFAGTGGNSKRVTGPNTYIDGTRNVMSGSLWIASQVGHYRYGEIQASGGMEFSVDAAPGPSGSVGKGALMRSMGYEGMYRASRGWGAPGFLIWSGSILPQSGDNYSGAGIEFWASGSSFHFDTTSGILSITGSINATSGTIGGWEILAHELRSYPNANMSLSGSGAGYLIARDENMIDRVFVGITPSASLGTDGFRDVSKYAGSQLLTNGNFETLAVPYYNDPTGWMFAWSGSASPSLAGTAHVVVTSATPTEWPVTVGSSVGPQIIRGTWTNAFFEAGSTAMAAHMCDSYAAGMFTSMSIYDEPNILKSSTYTLTFDTYASLSPYEGYGYAYAIVIIQQQMADASFATVKTQTFSLTPNVWTKGRTVTYTTALTGSYATGSLRIIIQSSTNRYDAVFYDNFELRAPQSFTDVNASGVFIWGDPITYLKLGAGGVSTAAISAFTASNATVNNDLSSSRLYVSNNIYSPGGYVDPASGILLTQGSNAAIHWTKDNTDYIASYAEITESARGREPSMMGYNGVLTPTGSITNNAYGTWGNTDFNVYNRIGGGLTKNRGWVFANSSYALHTDVVQIVLGSNGWLANEKGGVLVDGPIWTFNANVPNRMNKLLITGSWYQDSASRNPSSVAPSLQIVDGNQGAGKVLTSDASGYATWQPAAGGPGGGGTNYWVTSSGTQTIYPIPGGFKLAIGKTDTSVSLDVTGSVDITGSLSIKGGVYISGSLTGSHNIGASTFTAGPTVLNTGQTVVSIAPTFNSASAASVFAMDVESTATGKWLGGSEHYAIFGAAQGSGSTYMIGVGGGAAGALNNYAFYASSGDAVFTERVMIGKAKGSTINGALDVSGNAAVSGSLRVTGSFVPVISGSGTAGRVLQLGSSGDAYWGDASSPWTRNTSAGIIRPVVVSDLVSVGYTGSLGAKVSVAQPLQESAVADMLVLSNGVYGDTDYLFVGSGTRLTFKGGLQTPDQTYVANLAAIAGIVETNSNFLSAQGALVGYYINEPLTGNTLQEGFRLNGSGNFGIGTDAPSAKLHVSGSAIITGSLTTNGNLIVSGGSAVVSASNGGFLYLGKSLITGQQSGSVPVGGYLAGGHMQIYPDGNTGLDITAYGQDILGSNISIAGRQGDGGVSTLYISRYVDAIPPHEPIAVFDFSNTRFGINTVAPAATLGVNGNASITGSVTIKDGTQGSGKVFTSDADGVGSWQTPTATGTGTGMSWTYTTTNVTMSANTGYITSGSLVTLCLPTGCQTGSAFEVIGRAGTWKVTHNASTTGQQVFFGNANTTTGSVGYLSSTLSRDSIRMVCVSASYEFNVVSSVGNIEVV